MTKLGHRVLIGTGILAATILVVAVCVPVFFDVDRYKPSIEEALSRSLAMEFEIRGKAALRLLPRPRLTLRDIHLTKDTSEILSAEELRVSLRWIPLIFRRQVSIGRLALQKPQIRIEQPIAFPRPRGISSISVQDGEVSYLDQSSGRSVEVAGLKISLSGISWSEIEGTQFLARLKSLSLHGTLHATTVQVGMLHASDVKCGVKAEAGLLQLDPTEMTLFGARSLGSLTLDLRGSSPRMQVVQAASQVDLGQVFPGEVQYFSGTVQASLEAEGTGGDLSAITRTTRGHISIRGEHLSIHGWDVDQLVEDYHRTQKFNLIDLGAVLVAGPFGPLLTKGSDFARLYGGMGQGESEIRKLVSDWEIVDGIATAKDVAFSTLKNTVAFRGDVSLVNDSLENFFVATVDQHGCAQVKQQITGSFAHPHAPGLASGSVFGAIGSAVQGALNLGKPDRCELFYSGSALP
jgi:AsmA protein